MTLSIIVAVSENGVIGRQGGLPWHLPADLKWFKAKTVGHTLIMGRKTYESVGRPLPGRTTVVVTRDPHFVPDGVAIARSVDEAIGKAPGDDEVFVGGGGEVFRQILPAIHRMYITWVHAHVDGDTYFPEVDWSRWRETYREDHPADEKNAYPFSFVIYERVN